MSESFKRGSDGLLHIDKKPADDLDFTRNWALRLEQGETIVTSVWTAPAGISVGAASESSGKATVWLSGGVAGQTYLVSNRITTSAGRTVERDFVIDVKANLS